MTVIIEARIDPKDLASIVFLYIDRGFTFNSKSEAIRQMLHDMALTVRQVGAKKFETDEEAIHYLISTGMVLKPRQLSTKSVASALAEAKLHISTPAEPLDLTPDELKNIFPQLIDKSGES